MVNIEEISEPATTMPTPPAEEESPSASRLADAAELATLLPKVMRPTLKTQLLQLQTKLEKDVKALQRVEASKAKVEAAEETESAAAAAKPAAVAPVVQPVKAPVAVSVSPPASSSTRKYTPISTFSFDAGSYGSKTVSIYISLPGVGSIDKSNITCPFTSTSFDLSVHDLKGKNYRLVKDNLEHEIDADKSKLLIKSDKVVIKLAKVKGEYGSYDSWTDLTSKKGKGLDKKKKTDPSASIMELMKDMYDSGDDNMKKMIGETMLKQREGKLNEKPDLDSFKPDGL